MTRSDLLGVLVEILVTSRDALNGPSSDAEERLSEIKNLADEAIVRARYFTEARN